MSHCRCSIMKSSCTSWTCTFLRIDRDSIIITVFTLLLLSMFIPELHARRNKPDRPRSKHGDGAQHSKDDMWNSAMEAARKIKGDFDKLQENVNDLLSDINKGMDTALKGLETVQSILEHTEDKACIFQCGNGARPVQRADFAPTKDGCGSYGMKFNLSEYPQFETCCDAHDECYDTCGISRKYCDDSFHECLIEACDDMTQFGPQQSLCQTMADMIHAGAHTLGCKAYKDAQGNACRCTAGDGKMEL